MLKSRHVWSFAGAAFALLLSWPAAAQPVTFCDTNFPAASWALSVFSSPAGNNVTASPQITGGSISTTPPLPPAACPLNANYRDVEDILNIAGTSTESTVFGVHIFSGSYTPTSSGAIASIGFQIDFECPDTVGSCGANAATSSGVGIGPALLQNGNYFIANGAGTSSSFTGAPPGWLRFSTSNPLSPGTLVAANFNEITMTGSGANAVINIDTTTHPDFSATAKPIQCGFYTANSTSGSTFHRNAGVDNWVCAITPVPMSILKVCKVAGPGITIGTSAAFSYSSSVGSGNLPSVPAGPAPGGNCVLGPSLPPGTVVTVTEDIPIGSSTTVSGIAINGQMAGSFPGSTVNGNRVTFPMSSGVAEVTYTDQAPTGYLEICKQRYNSQPAPALAGNFTFTVTGISGPIVVPLGACSPALQVPVGNLTIQENPQPGSSLVACTANPPSQQVNPCNLTTGSLTVNVAQGAISTQTIATFTNQGTLINPGGGNTNSNK
jgi:hypothetical protein